MAQKAYDIYIGADPELFVRDTEKNVFLSGHDLIPGTKEDPFEVVGGAVQVDGTTCEFNVTPAKTSEEFQRNISAVISRMSKIIHLKNEKFELIASPTVLFDKDYFKNLPEEAKAFGCSADYNAWTGKTNPPPKTTLPLRTGGGHVHVGWRSDGDPTAKAHLINCSDITKQLDTVLFVLSHAWDKDEKRRTLYGRMGSFRPKFYGCEYRPLSNAWLRDQKTIDWVFKATYAASERFFEGNFIFEDKRALRMTRKPRLTKKVLKNYSSYLADQFGIPTLPEETLEG